MEVKDLYIVNYETLMKNWESISSHQSGLHSVTCTDSHSSYVHPCSLMATYMCAQHGCQPHPGCCTEKGKTSKGRCCTPPGAWLRKSQDGGVSKHSLPPHTTTAKITTKLQNNYHPNHQKIKLYGSPTTKELKKSHPSRWVGGVEMCRHRMDGPTTMCGG